MKIAKYSRNSSKAGPIFGIALILLLGLRAFLTWRAQHQLDAAQVGFIVVWFAFVMLIVYLQLVIAREIIVHANDAIEFVGWARHIHVQAREIRSIRWFLGYKSVRSNFLVVRLNPGVLLLADKIEGFHHFLSDLKEANPSARLPR